MRVFKVLAFAGALMMAFSGVASAMDFKATGKWEMNFGYHANRTMYDKNHGTGAGDDPFKPTIRIRPNFTVTASENLSATLMFEIGDIFWGRGSANGTGGGAGGGLDGDGINMELRRAYVDWAIPGTPIKVRSGLQGVSFPWATRANPIMGADVFGVTTSVQFTDTVGMTLGWIRPYDLSETDSADSRLQDEMDVFLLTLPIRNKAVRLTPWAAVGFLGRDSEFYGRSAGGASTGPLFGRNRYVPLASREDNAMPWWAGFSLELPVVQPFIVKLGGMYGELEADDDYGTSGYYFSGELGYAWSWGKTSLIGWYSSGDDADGDYGTIPTLSDDSGFGQLSYFGNGQRDTNRDKQISGNMLATWGAGFQIADVSFVPDLKHDFRAVVIKGTNSGDRINGDTPLYTGSGSGNGRYAYMVTTDTAYAFEFENTYKVTNNFQLALDFYYAHMDLSQQRAERWRETEDPWAVIFSFNFTY